MWFFHPLSGDGYQFWSGIAGSFLTSIPGWFIAITLMLRQHNCHVKGCWRRGHIDPAVHHPACKNHHSHGHLLGEAPSATEGE